MGHISTGTSGFRQTGVVENSIVSTKRLVGKEVKILKKRMFIRRDSLAERGAVASQTLRYNLDGTATYFTDGTLRTMAPEEPSKTGDSILWNKLVARRRAERDAAA